MKQSGEMCKLGHQWIGGLVRERVLGGTTSQDKVESNA